MTTNFKLPVPKGMTINISKIYNPVDPKNLVNRKPKTIEETVDLLEQNPKIMAILHQKKAQGIKYSASKFGYSSSTPIRDIVFDSIAQREINQGHIASTLENYDECLTSPVYLADVGGVLYDYDTMHGVNEFALLCKHGFIIGVDPDKWLDATYASYIVPNASAGLPAYAAMTRNGLGQKKWTSFDHHKTKVGLARQYPSQYGKMFAKEVKLQDLCEKYEVIPVSKDSPYSKKAGTISRVDALTKYEFNALEFTFSRHKAHLHGTKLDEAAYGYYSNMYTYGKSVGWTKKKIEGLAEHLDAVVYDFFTDLAGARIVVENTHAKWFKSCNPLSKKIPNPSDDCFLSIIEKIYDKLNGTREMTSHVHDYVHKGVDIYDFLPDEILQKVDNYVQNNLVW